MTALKDMDLGKWPRLVCTGELVTPKQAYEIIIRTTEFNNLDTNPGVYEKSNDVLKFFGLPTVECHGLIEDYKKLQAVEESLGSLSRHLRYLNNQRFYSSWVFGAHGWCNWDGNIFTNNYTVGKYPSCKELYNELVLIAKTFPFLKAEFQFAKDNYETETCVPLIEFKLSKGTVKYNTTNLSIKPTSENHITPETYSHRDIRAWDWYLLQEVKNDLITRYSGGVLCNQ